MAISLSDDVPKMMRSDLLNSTSPISVQQRMVYAKFASDMQVDVNFHVNVSFLSYHFCVQCLHIYIHIYPNQIQFELIYSILYHN